MFSNRLLVRRFPNEPPLRVFVEPWALEHVVNAGEVGEVVAFHPETVPTFWTAWDPNGLVVGVNETGCTYEFRSPGRPTETMSIPNVFIC
jgi:hypothetical protein